MTTFLAGPAISLLVARSRMQINRKQRAGEFGKTLRLGRRIYSQRTAVEAAFGVTFTDEQIAFAVGRQLDRLVAITDHEEPDGTASEE